MKDHIQYHYTPEQVAKLQAIVEELVPHAPATIQAINEDIQAGKVLSDPEAWRVYHLTCILADWIFHGN